MGDVLTRAIDLLLCKAAGAACGFASVMVFNALPVKWLCDYNEKPDPSLYKKRVFLKTHGISLAAIYAVFICLTYLRYGFTLYLFFAVALYLLLSLISLADIKYFIIPDEILIILALFIIALSAFDIITEKNVLHNSFISPFLGALTGGAALFIIGLTGNFIYSKEETMGFGDVKLMAVLGFAAGFHGILIVLLLTVLTSGISFAVMIAARKLKRHEYKPLGPYIAISFVIYYIFHSYIYDLIYAYISLFRL